MAKPPRIWLILAYNCQKFRQKLHLSQEQFALKANIHRTAYHKYESGKASPNLETLERLAKAFRVEIGDLLRDPGGSLSRKPLFRMPRGTYSRRTRKASRRPGGMAKTLPDRKPEEVRAGHPEKSGSSDLKHRTQSNSSNGTETNK